MADYFSSYFPVAVTGGTANPMVGAEAVQGQSPQPLELGSIIEAIQSQYTPQTFTHSGGSYGAQRFIDPSAGPIGLPSVGGAAPSWFTPGEFNLADYQANLPEQVAEQVATGELYGGGDYSPVSSAESQAWQSDPYYSLFNPIPGLVRAGINQLIPGAGMLIGAGQGYQNAIGANAMQTALSAYGGQPNTAANPMLSALMGVIGQSPQGVENAQALASQFDNPQNLYGYMAAATDPAISQIAESLIGRSGGTLNANQVGSIGYAIGEQVNSLVANGLSLNDAVQSAAQGYGIPAGEAAAMAANLNTQDPLGQLISNLNVVSEAPAAVSDPGSLMGTGFAGAGLDAGYVDSISGAESYGGGGATDSGGLMGSGFSGAGLDAGYADSISGAEGGGYVGTSSGGVVSDSSGNAVSFGGDSGGGGGSGGGGCVIATHAVANGSFTPREKRKAVLWCTKTLHNKWWGEAIRRGYRFYGLRAIKAGKAENYYEEFRDFVRFATKTKRTAKTAKTFIWRSIQFFVTGIFLKD